MNLVIKKIIKSIYRKFPNKLKAQLGYYLNFREWPNLNQPLTFNEKVLNRILYDRNMIYPLLADKYEVRTLIGKILGEEFLVPLLFMTDTPENLMQLSDWSKTVIKPNHGAGMVKIFDHDPSRRDKEQVIKLANNWLKLNYSILAGEWHYAHIKPYILVEEKITELNEDLRDYKFHRFKQKDGSYKQILQVVAERSVKGYETVFFDLNNLDCILHSPFGYQLTLSDLEKECIAKICNLNLKLIPEINYVRLDWYITTENIYFGEITLTPGAGRSKSFAGNFGLEMGKLWIAE
ncbi:ATP-grasp fold amidoligase family protein [Acinetobacter sp. YH01009]|uniref:ATP-grasp fold amidoligase family protein n=1 Tax=Acinetobacter sp. YH01009 TaxID=2601025 RepID=UPI0015D30C2F|nr:ATP-grasp fold amidoligase family protein [Acinetobacter sp. YH01009]